jgi:hypothetical protein
MALYASGRQQRVCGCVRWWATEQMSGGLISVQLDIIWSLEAATVGFCSGDTVKWLSDLVWGIDPVGVAMSFSICTSCKHVVAMMKH